MSLGQRTNLALKDKGDNSMCAKRGAPESVVGSGCARPACHGESWIASSPGLRRCSRRPPAEHLPSGVDPYRWFSIGYTVLSGDQALTYAVNQENERATYHTLERPSATYHGIAYRARAPGRQSL